MPHNEAEFMRKFLKIPRKSRTLANLPRDSIAEILSFLDDGRDWSRLSRVCRELHEDLNMDETKWGMSNMMFYIGADILLDSKARVPLERIYKLWFDSSKIGALELYEFIAKKMPRLMSVKLPYNYNKLHSIEPSETVEKVTFRFDKPFIEMLGSTIDRAFPNLKNIKLYYVNALNTYRGIHDIAGVVRECKKLETLRIAGDSPQTAIQEALTEIVRHPYPAFKLIGFPDTQQPRVITWWHGPHWKTWPGPNVDLTRMPSTELREDMDFPNIVAILNEVMSEFPSPRSAADELRSEKSPKKRAWDDGLSELSSVLVSSKTRANGKLCRVSRTRVHGSSKNRIQTIYNVNGVVVARFEMKYGDRHGYSERYDSKAGKVVFAGYYKYSKLVGKCRYYRNDGTLEVQREFDEDEECGTWLYYAKDGKTVVRRENHRRNTAFDPVVVPSSDEDDDDDDYDREVEYNQNLMEDLSNGESGA